MDVLRGVLENGALEAARALLGWKLVTNSVEGRTAGIIVETEAYTELDPASHSYRGQTLRNAAMYAPAGTVYVYFTYGMHYCINIACGRSGQGEAVLIRALEPIEGTDIMAVRRKKTDNLLLTNGPAKLVQALGITIEDNFTPIGSSRLHLEPGVKPRHITETTRVGISKAIDQPWRFFITGNPYVTR